MRTTVTIDDDVLKQIEERAAKEKRSRKDVLNETLRRGIEAASSTRTRSEIRRTRPQDLGRPLLPSLDNVAEALAVAEGDDFA
jgi:predicted transcriptional regulator